MKGNRWEIIAKLKGSKLRREVLSTLKENPKTPQEIERITKIKFSHVSDKLRELLEYELVKCLTPMIRKGKLYSITASGKNILNKIK